MKSENAFPADRNRDTESGMTWIDYAAIHVASSYIQSGFVAEEIVKRSYDLAELLYTEKQKRENGK